MFCSSKQPQGLNTIIFQDEPANESGCSSSPAGWKGRREGFLLPGDGGHAYPPLSVGVLVLGHELDHTPAALGDRGIVLRRKNKQNNTTDCKRAACLASAVSLCGRTSGVLSWPGPRASSSHPTNKEFFTTSDLLVPSDY